MLAFDKASADGLAGNTLVKTLEGGPSLKSWSRQTSEGVSLLF